MAPGWSHKGLLGCVTDAGAQTRGWVKKPTPICGRMAVLLSADWFSHLGRATVSICTEPGWGILLLMRLPVPSKILPVFMNRRLIPIAIALRGRH